MSRRVSENAGTVNNFVCIDISGGSGCPASFGFEVELSTSGSGKYMCFHLTLDHV